MNMMEAKNVRFSKPQLADLEKMAEERGVKVPELIRRALDEYIDKWKAAKGGK